MPPLGLFLPVPPVAPLPDARERPDTGSRIWNRAVSSVKLQGYLGEAGQFLTLRLLPNQSHQSLSPECESRRWTSHSNSFSLLQEGMGLG
jgi:hypothetical protein